MLSSEAGDATTLAFVSLKAFGDYVIARSALRRAGEAGEAAHMVIGEHLLPLHKALGGRERTHVIPQGASVPAVFDVKKAGLAAALCSSMRMRRGLRHLTRQAGLTLVFDRLGPRERFLGAGGRACALPAADNIYRAYASFLGAEQVLPERPAVSGAATKVGIFPGSRITSKQLPQTLIDRIASASRASGLDVTVFCLDGEPVATAGDGTAVKVVPRSFDAMRDAVDHCDFVISADSMPAHLAEFLGRPVFVVSPVPNAYWLPLSSFVSGDWVLFGDVAHIDDRLATFFTRP